MVRPEWRTALNRRKDCVMNAPDPAPSNLPRPTPGPIVFRRAEAGDRRAVEALQHAAYARNRRLLGVEPLPLQADYADIFAAMEVWLAEERGVLRGALILEPRADDMLIWSIAASPDAQRQGIGQIMLDAAEVRARQLDLSTMRLNTGAVLETLVHWYHRHGYEVERLEELPDRKVLHMIKHLPPTL
jgi:ribosomal protein S18 acetylase RimI-like enzyme